MVKRIKKYKISLRPSAVLRLFKKRIPENLPEEELEKKIELALPSAHKYFKTYAAYEVFSPKELPETLKELWKGCPNGSVSIAFIASTIGNSLETEWKKIQNSNDSVQAALLESIGMEAQDQSFLFAVKLLQEESKLEGCDSTNPQVLDSTYTRECLGLLQIKDEIFLDSEEKLIPLYSRIGFCFWTPLKKK